LVTAYVPERGDVVFLDFRPQTGHEQSGRRPAVVLSPSGYNRKVGMAILCPITTRVKGYPFEVLIPDECEITGAILADQIKSLDWKARRAQFECALPKDVIEETVGKISALLTQEC
jgi:mRNA interferase MazF